MIFTRHDSNINSLQDLTGKTFAFGDPNSTMSYVVPNGMLAEAGITKDKLARHDFLYSHHNVALAVLGGYFDAGAVKEEVFYEFEKKGIKLIEKSPPIAEHLFVTRSNLPENLIEEIRYHLLNIAKDKDKDRILHSMKSGTTNLIPVVDEDYDTLRKILAISEQ